MSEVLVESNCKNCGRKMFFDEGFSDEWTHYDTGKWEEGESPWCGAHRVGMKGEPSDMNVAQAIAKQEKMRTEEIERLKKENTPEAYQILMEMGIDPQELLKKE